MSLSIVCQMPIDPIVRYPILRWEWWLMRFRFLIKLGFPDILEIWSDHPIIHKSWIWMWRKMVHIFIEILWIYFGPKYSGYYRQLNDSIHEYIKFIRVWKNNNNKVVIFISFGKHVTKSRRHPPGIPVWYHHLFFWPLSHHIGSIEISKFVQIIALYKLIRLLGKVVNPFTHHLVLRRFWTSLIPYQPCIFF